MISTPIGGFSGDSSLGLGGTWCRARSIAAEDFDAGVDVAMGSAHQDCGPVGFSTVQNCAGSCIYCCMYPRVGARLVPEVLVAVLGDELLLPSVSSELGLPRSLRIGQLDEQAAALGDPYTRIVLGREVARCARVRWRRIVGLEVMVSFGGRSAPELELSTRACKHLLRINPAGRGTPESEPLRNMTVSELALIPGFGPECLLEVLSVAKRAPRVPRVSPSSPSSPPPSPVRALARKTPSPLCAPSRELLLAARALARAPWSASVSWEDPRLGGLVREINRDARSPRDAAERTLERCRYRHWEQRHLLGAIGALTRAVDRLQDQPLDLELEGIVDAVLDSPRSRAVVLARLGFGGRPPVTLEAAGRMVGLTREGVRQIEKRFHEAVTAAVEAGGVWAPALERALRSIRATGLVSEARLQARLSRKGLIPEGFSAASVLAAAKVLGKPLEVYAARGLISGRPVAVTPERIGEIATRLVSYWGLTTIEDVCVQVAEETSFEVSERHATLLLETHKNFSWLDRQDGWCWLYPAGKNRLLNQVSKIMSVTPSLSVEDLQRGIARHHDMRDLSAPRHVLARLCEDTGLYEHHDGRILAKPGHPHWRQTLGEHEATIVEVLLDHGPIMTFEDLRRIVVQEKGVKPCTFTMHLGSSPPLIHHAHGVYGLRGTHTRQPRAR